MKERTTRRVTAIVVDENDVGLDVAVITAIKMTLYDKKTSDIINSRDAQDIKNANNVTISSVGALVWTVQVLDNIIVTATEVLEHHVALIEWTWNVGNNSGHDEIDIFVQNTVKVP